MTSRGFKIGVVSLAIMGILVSFLVKPRGYELAYMNLMDKSFSSSLEMYEKLWEKGDRAINVTIPLSDLYIQYGKVSKAIDILEEYLTIHSTSVEVRKKLSIYYRYASREEDYLKNLEAMAELSPDADMLRELSDIYNFYGEYDKQIEIINLVLSKFKPIKEDYLKLIYLYAAKRDYEKSSELIKNLFESSDNKDDEEVLLFAISVLMDAGNLEDAQYFVSEYIKNNKGSSLVIHLAQLMSSKGFAKEALEFIRPFQNEYRGNPSFLAVMIDVKMSLERYDDAYITLDKIYHKEGSVPDSLLENYFKLIVEKEDFKTLENLVKDTDIYVLSEDILLRIAEVVLENGRFDISSLIVEKLGGDFLASNKTLEIAYSLSDPNVNPEEIIWSDDVLLPFSAKRMIILSKIALNANMEDLAKKILSSFKAQHISDEIAYDLVELFIESGWEEYGLELFSEAKEENDNKSGDVVKLWSLLAIAAGKEQEFRNEVDLNSVTDEKLLEDIFNIAGDYKKYDIAFDAAQRLFDINDNKKHKDIYTKALVQTKRYFAALPYLREVVKTDISMAETYVKSIAGSINEKDSGDRDISSLRAELGSYINLEIMSNNNLSHIQKAVAYALLEYGFRNEANTIFIQLASNSKGRHQSLWLKELAWGGYPEAVVEMWGNGAADKEDDEVFGAYIEALVSAKSTKKDIDVKGEMQKELMELGRIGDSSERMKTLSLAAMNSGYLDVAEQGLNDFMKFNENDKESRLNLGLIYFYRSNYEKSSELLLKYAESNGEDYRAYYHLAQIYKQNKEKSEARRYFNKSLEILLSKKSRGLYERVDEVHILLYLKRLDESLALFRSLVADNPSNKELLADFADYLISIDRFDEAEEILQNQNNHLKDKKSLP